MRGGEIEESKGDAVGLIIDGLLSWMDRVLDSQSTFLASFFFGEFHILFRHLSDSPNSKALIQGICFAKYVLPIKIECMNFAIYSINYHLFISCIGMD